MRHGLAVEPEEWEGEDSQRPLTPQGHDKTHIAARGLAIFWDRPDLIVTSPKVRALQTAEIVREELKARFKTNTPLKKWPELASGDLGSWLQKLKDSKADSVWLVGHEPDLSRFASLHLAQDADKMQLEFKKAGALCLEIDVATGTTTLLWMLPPRALRRMSH